MIEQVVAAIRAQSKALGLDPRRLQVEPILNWGGFVNHSFRVSDGRSALCVKLASDPDALAGLERWRRFATVLEERYHAPRMVGWIDESDLLLGGPAFEWIEGAVPTAVESPGVLGAAAVLPELHGDRSLAEALAARGDEVRSCAEAYRRSYHRRFLADLDFIGTTPPPFVAADLLDWLRSEAVALEASVLGLASFAEPADRPIHADLWWNNLLVTRAGRWYVLDWDGLSLGDPTVDWAMLFGPTRERVRFVEEEAATRSKLAAAGRERLRAYARASLLDWIIDPLSDWVQAGVEPFHSDAIREGNERVHREALAAYRERYARARSARAAALRCTRALLPAAQRRHAPA